MDKPFVRSLFDSIAARYDFLNHFLSGGVDVLWRRKAIRLLSDTRPKRILDVACGTADFSLEALRLGPEEVIGVDVAEKMIEVGREKVRKRRAEQVISLRTGEAENLQFPDESFDAAIVAFGVRNFEDLQRGLGEMRRVLRSGGRIVVLEFSRPSVFPLRQLYLFYFRRLLPFMGRLISGHPFAYRYLHDSVMAFPEGKEFVAYLEQSGFKEITDERLSFGIATVYSGIRA